MATYAAWNKHFDTQTTVSLNKKIKAIDELLKDKMIAEEYGQDLKQIKILINASKNMR